MSEILLPSLGAEMDEGTLLEWYVKPGDLIERGQVIALLDTDKAEIEMEAFESGTIERLLIEPGQTVPVGEPVARLQEPENQAKSGRSKPIARSEGGEPTAPAPSRPEPSRAAPRSFEETREDRVPQDATRTEAHQPTRVRATPLARRLARENGIELEGLQGSGPGGAILEADIRPRASVPRGTIETTRIARRREIIAAAMVRSKREIPHYYLSTPIEIRRASDWLAAQNLNRTAGERIVLSALLMKAVARAAKRFPEFNGHWVGDGFRASGSVDLGMVVSLRSAGLVVPTFRNVDEKSVIELMTELRDVVGRSRAGRLRSGELGDATLTITSLGDDGAETVFGVIYPPQVAIVGFGGIHAALRVDGEMHGTQPIVRASLAADHRASDGQRGSEFLRSISKHLNDPEEL